MCGYFSHGTTNSGFVFPTKDDNLIGVANEENRNILVRNCLFVVIFALVNLNLLKKRCFREREGYVPLSDRKKLYDDHVVCCFMK